jgi:putative Holliday junction resolvase
MKRIIGIDYGERRVGLAVSDELGITAQGLETFDRKTGDILEHLTRLVAQYGVKEFVVGHPLSMSGQPSDTTKNAERFAVKVREQLGVVVTLWDERLSSEEARRVVKGSRADKQAIDRIAAVLILQSYLDSKA